MNSNREKITNIVMVGVFAAMLAVLSQISFPLPSGIPVTLQTFAVALCGYALGCKRGTLAVSRQGHRLRCGSLRRSDRPQFRAEEERHSHRSVKAFSQSVWNKIETEKAVCKGKSRAGGLLL